MKISKIIIILILLLFLTSCSLSNRPVGNRVDKVIETMDALDCYTLDYVFLYKDDVALTETVYLSHQISVTYDQVNHIRFFKFHGDPDSNYYVHEVASYLEVYRLHDGVWLIEAIPLNDSNDHENEFLDFIFASMNKDGRVSFAEILIDAISISVEVLFSDMISTMEIEWFELDEVFSNLDIMEDENVIINANYMNGEPTYINWFGISILDPTFSDPSKYYIDLSAIIYQVPLLELPPVDA